MTPSSQGMEQPGSQDQILLIQKSKSEMKPFQSSNDEDESNSATGTSLNKNVGVDQTCFTAA
jgi:hypothetical protein